MKLFFKKGASYPLEKIIYAKPNTGKCMKCGNPVVYSPKVEISENSFRVLGFTMRSSRGQTHICDNLLKSLS